MLIYTLVDITETKSYRSPDQKANHQQANFMTFFQTLCLGINFLYNKSPEIIDCDEKKLRDLGFGSEYKGNHTVWCLEAWVDDGREEPPVENLINDFDLVPVIPGLDETIVINNNVFRTTDKKAKNIIFKEANIT
jgi:hypothetical protein|tara:strand:+ start:91 stop:495 length:405 start_codon:yes stop_codon:yes gene_type:complete